jgi:hypothetical protein
MLALSTSKELRKLEIKSVSKRDNQFYGRIDLPVFKLIDPAERVAGFGREVPLRPILFHAQLCYQSADGLLQRRCLPFVSESLVDFAGHLGIIDNCPLFRFAL